MLREVLVFRAPPPDRLTGSALMEHCMLTRAGVRYRSGREVKLEIPASFFPTAGQQGLVMLTFAQRRAKRYVAEGQVRLDHGIFSGDWQGHSTEVGRMRREKIGVHYYKNIDAANDTLAKVRERRSDGFIVQADVNRTDDIRGMMDHVKSEFG